MLAAISARRCIEGPKKKKKEEEKCCSAEVCQYTRLSPGKEQAARDGGNRDAKGPCES